MSSQKTAEAFYPNFPSLIFGEFSVIKMHSASKFSDSLIDGMKSITNDSSEWNVFGQRTHILRGDQGYTSEIMDEILTTARDLELEVNEDDIEELIMGHEDELTTEHQ
ncbi:hypothetical protein TNCV_3999551 [Trichonephila clavipes]|nr:hypothetical protein TNCV_3999551 [Trichonephila clavipes]